MNAHPLAALSLEADLESRIERARKAMETAFHFGDLDTARARAADMAKLISQRSDEVVERMEKERGLG